MKIIWIVNMAFSDAETMTISNINVTWLETMLLELKGQEEMVVCCPLISKKKQLVKVIKEGVLYYGIPRRNKRGTVYESGMKGFFKEVFEIEKPDVIHIWGTEFPHTLSAVMAAEESGLLDVAVISIQGLVSVYAQHFMGNVPFTLQYAMVPKNFVRGYNLAMTRASYKKRGKYEREAIRKVRHIIGRTDWDKACSVQMNPNVEYHKNNETLRRVFYDRKWEYGKCIPYRIFMSQGGSPIKGMHNLIEAMNIVQRDYPQVHLYITGRNVLGTLSLKQRLSFNPYDWFIRKKIYQYGLENKVTFLGSLSAEEMAEQYCLANVFVLPSAIENSPNSLGEAMLIGTPSIAADVGGVKNLIEHGKEGYIYQHDAPYMLAYYILRVFQENVDLLTQMAMQGREHAKKIYNIEQNKQCLIHIYKCLS